MNPIYKNKKALVVDNSPIITKILKKFLSQIGFDRGHIFAAHEKHKAQIMFELESFDLVTSGIHLKDGDGIDLLKELRRKRNWNPDKTHFLIISSEKPETYQRLIGKYKAKGFLRKPFNQDQFQKTINSIFNQPDLVELIDKKSTASSSIFDSTWEDSPIEIPDSIIEAFTASTVEAMEQYMVEVIPGNSEKLGEFNGYFSSMVDLIDSENRMQLTLIINFSKKAACDIYEGLFGEVDIEQVGGVVQELCNIIGGITKPRISEFPQDFAKVVYPEKDFSAEELKLSWDLGLPESKIGEGHSLNIEINGVPKFHVPFKIKDETFHLIVLLQKF